MLGTGGFGGTLAHDVDQARMSPQRLGNAKRNAWEARRQAVAIGAQIAADVNPGREKIRHENHPRCAAGDTLRCRLFDSGRR